MKPLSEVAPGLFWTFKSRSKQCDLVGAIFQPNQFSLQSVLQQASSIMSSGDDHLLTTIQEHYTMAGQLISLTKKQGVSGKNVNF